jgi:hypothetical protein
VTHSLFDVAHDKAHLPQRAKQATHTFPRFVSLPFSPRTSRRVAAASTVDSVPDVLPGLLRGGRELAHAL